MNFSQNEMRLLSARQHLRRAQDTLARCRRMLTQPMIETAEGDVLRAIESAYYVQRQVEHEHRRRVDRVQERNAECLYHLGVPE